MEEKDRLLGNKLQFSWRGHERSKKGEISESWVLSQILNQYLSFTLKYPVG
jgi:hypothetical protein